MRVTHPFATSAIEAIGQTPLIALDRVHGGPGRIVAKAEFLQREGSRGQGDPSGRPSGWPFAAEHARRRNDQRQYGGRTGGGLRNARPSLGRHDVGGQQPGTRADDGTLGRRSRPGRSGRWSAGPSDGAGYEAAAAIARQIASDRNGFYVDQFHAVEGIAAHEVTGEEILAQLGHAPDGWVAAVGTGCTFLGVAKTLRRANPATVCVVVEPQGSRPLAGVATTNARHVLQGIGYGTIPPHWDPSLMTFGLSISDSEAEEWRSLLARREGLYVGYSAAANVCAAAKLLQSGKVRADGVVATVLCDTGFKY